MDDPKTLIEILISLTSSIIVYLSINMIINGFVLVSILQTHVILFTPIIITCLEAVGPI